MTSRKGNFSSPRKDTVYTTPSKPSNGEMYNRPKPNPFSEDWCIGYDCGIRGDEAVLGLRDPYDFWDGYKYGQLERKELDRSGSSNT